MSTKLYTNESYIMPTLIQLFQATFSVLAGEKCGKKTQEIFLKKITEKYLSKWGITNYNTNTDSWEMRFSLMNQI